MSKDNADSKVAARVSAIVSEQGSFESVGEDAQMQPDTGWTKDADAQTSPKAVNGGSA